MLPLIWSIPAFPLVGTLLNLFFGRWTGRHAHWVSVPAVGLSFIFSAVTFRRVWGGETFTGPLFEWIVVGTFQAAATVQVDPLSAVMLLVVTGVGFLIHLYSIGYMAGDPGYARYFAYLNLFLFSMVMLVLSGNFLLLYVFWEAVGLCSYLLIGFWYERPAAAEAGKKAFIVNRVGDFGFGLGVMLLWTTLGTLDYAQVFARAESLAPATATVIALLLFLGACGKSAQLPLHTWLPDAMEGPTPVSALIHAATMVTAGVYMVARSHALFERSGVALEVVAWVGILTALFAASIGLAQTDIKRVLAYSTISQLGYMFVGVGVGAYAAGIYHLVTHAFFKALLFLCAGSVIHALGGEQDIRKMGGLAPKMAATTLTFLVAAVAIAGIPPFAGFFSKDEILAAAWHSGHRTIWLLGLGGALMTAFYIFRLVFLTFFGSPRMSREAARHLHESPRVMTFPLWVLAILAATAGIIGIPSRHGTTFERFLAPVFLHGGATGGHAPSMRLLVISVASGIAGILIAWAVYVRRPMNPARIGVPRNPLHRLLLAKYYVDELYGALIVQPIYRLSLACAGVFDLRVIDGAVNGIAGAIAAWAETMRRVQTGYVRNYALGMLVGAVAIIAYFLARG